MILATSIFKAIRLDSASNGSGVVALDLSAVCEVERQDGEMLRNTVCGLR